MFDYAEFVIGGLHNRNKILRLSEAPQTDGQTDCFRSVFLFDQDLRRFVEQTGSVSGYAGLHKADALVFDFDSDDLETVRGEARDFCLYLNQSLDVPLESLRLSFSGSKGFHIALPIEALGDVAPRRNFWQVYKAVAQDLCQGFKCADMSIYEMRRLFRLLNTINSKSGLYKIPLSWKELCSLTLADIRTLAAASRHVDALPASELRPVPALTELYLKWREYDFTSLTKKTRPDASVHELVTILKGVTEPGRTDAATKLIGLYLSRGFDEAFTLSFLRIWNERNSPPLKDAKLEYTVHDVFTRYRKTAMPIPVYSLLEAERAYLEHIENLEKSCVKIGYPAVDKKCRGLMRGETMCILGKTSVGKSAFLQNIGQRYARQSGEPVLFFSMEMPLTSVFERMLQIETGFTGYEVESYYRAASPEFIASAGQARAQLPHFYTITNSGLDLDAIKDMVRRAESDIYKRKTGLVLVDYLGLVNGKGDDIYQQVSRVARGMKDVAKELDVPIIFLSQITKKYGEYDELELGAARDSGSVDEASDFVLGLWKDRQAEDATTITLNLAILKNRRGGTGKIAITMSKKNLRIEEIN